MIGPACFLELLLNLIERSLLEEGMATGTSSWTASAAGEKVFTAVQSNKPKNCLLY